MPREALIHPQRKRDPVRRGSSPIQHREDAFSLDTATPLHRSGSGSVSPKVTHYHRALHRDKLAASDPQFRRKLRKGHRHRRYRHGAGRWNPMCRFAMMAAAAVRRLGLAAVVLAPAGATQAVGFDKFATPAWPTPFRREGHWDLDQQSGEAGGARPPAIRDLRRRGHYE